MWQLKPLAPQRYPGPTTGGRADVYNAQEQRKLEAEKILENLAESPRPMHDVFSSACLLLSINDFFNAALCWEIPKSVPCSNVYVLAHFSFYFREAHCMVELVILHSFH